MEGWNEIVLGKLGNTFTGLSGKTKDDFGFGSKYIQYVNIFNNSKIDIENLDLVNVKSNEKQSKVKFGDIFFTTSSETIEEVGMSSVLLDEINEDIYLNSFCFGFRMFDFNNLLPEYAQHLLRAAHMRHSISMFGKGSTRYNLSKTLLLKDLVLVFPSSISEQHKIATILNTLDQSISKTKKLIANYKNIKQGLMHDLLNYGIDENGTIRNPQTHTFVEKKGLIVPEEWEVAEINDVVTIGNGCDYKHLKEGTIPVLGTGGYMTSVNDYLYDGETVCIGRKGTIDFPQYHTGKIWTVDTLFYTHSFKNILPKLLFFIFQTINWKKYNEATGVPSLSKKTISKIKISFPTKIDEQQKIISIIEQQDKLIESEQTNLAKLQNLKQGLTADLLTGKVRLKI